MRHIIMQRTAEVVRRARNSLVLESLSFKPHLSILSCRAFCYYLCTNLQHRYKDYKDTLISMFPLLLLLKVR